jgi:hypothetical protein
MNNEIELIVKLKYKIANNSDDWSDLKFLYPEVVRKKLQSRYDAWLKCDSNAGKHYLELWEVYSSYLFEELCKYESKQNE